MLTVYILVGICVLIGVIIGTLLNRKDRLSIKAAKKEAQQILEHQAITDLKRAKLVQKSIADRIYEDRFNKDIELEDIWHKLQSLIDRQTNPTKKPF